MAAPNPDAEPDTPDELPDAAVEARWADIVAQLGALDRPDAPAGAAPSGTAPSRGDDDGAAAEAPAPAADPAPLSRAAGPRDWPLTPEVEALEDAESHFTPPEPDPVLSRDPLLTMAWAAVAGVPILTVVLVVVRALLPSLHLPGWLGPAGGVLFLAAVAVLLWRMPHRRDPEDDDTGAVV
ncbi:hypothetical protein GCM10009809_38840 [Isoptericola hypogeus]|uniref:DUF308 domain-containing protein n=1 Tax=Isoptericola hypogeus TaxID=300179 RepID=A0ABN2JUQ8_9MICO